MPDLRLPLSLPPRIVAAYAPSEHRGEERYRHVRFWCLNLYHGHGVLQMHGRSHPIVPGSVSLTPPDTDHVYRFRGTAQLSWVHFIPDATAIPAPMPVMRVLGRAFDGLHGDVVNVVRSHEAEPARAVAMLWAVLWRLAAGPAGEATPTHQAVRLVQSLVEQRLGAPRDLALLARHAGVSPTHLNRLFRAATGCPVMAWVRQRRIAHAVMLLRHTRLGVAEIARQLGYVDMQHLNKALRQADGRSPRQIRHG